VGVGIDRRILLRVKSFFILFAENSLESFFAGATLGGLDMIQASACKADASAA
jgi:hypothetical protein